MENNTWDRTALNKAVYSLKNILDNTGVITSKDSKSYEEYLYLGHLFYEKLLKPVLPSQSNFKRLTLYLTGI